MQNTVRKDYTDFLPKVKEKNYDLSIDYSFVVDYYNMVYEQIEEKEYIMIPKEEFDQEIQNILKQLIELYKPEKVLLFGSLAKGKINQGTDIDLFIIKNEVPELGVDRIRQLDALINYKLGTDFIVYKPTEVEQRLKLGDPFIKSILEEGKVLYDAA